MTESNMADTGSNYSAKYSLSDIIEPIPASFESFLKRLLRLKRKDQEEIKNLTLYIFKVKPP